MHIAVTTSHDPPSRNRCRFSDGGSRVVYAVYNGLRIIGFRVSGLKVRVRRGMGVCIKLVDLDPKPQP